MQKLPKSTPGHGDFLGPSGAPAPPVPPCKKVPWACPTVHNPYYNYFSKTRCTFFCSTLMPYPSSAARLLSVLQVLQKQCEPDCISSAGQDAVEATQAMHVSEAPVSGLHACRYDPTCTLRQSHPGIAFAPAPNDKTVITNLPPIVVPLASLTSPQPFSSGTVSAFSTGGK